jgi:hypothetical protein
MIGLFGLGAPASPRHGVHPGQAPCASNEGRLLNIKGPRWNNRIVQTRAPAPPRHGGRRPAMTVLGDRASTEAVILAQVLRQPADDYPSWPATVPATYRGIVVYTEPLALVQMAGPAVTENAVRPANLTRMGSGPGTRGRRLTRVPAMTAKSDRAPDREPARRASAGIQERCADGAGSSGRASIRATSSASLP